MFPIIVSFRKLPQLKSIYADLFVVGKTKDLNVNMSVLTTFYNKNLVGGTEF